MMKLKNRLKKAGLLTTVAAIGSFGLVAQSQAYVYARSYLDISDLTISTYNDGGGTNDPVAGTYSFEMTTTSKLNGVLGAQGDDDCVNCTSTPVIDPLKSALGADPSAENDFNFYGPTAAPAGAEFARADAIVTAAQLATGTPSAGEQIAEAQLQTGTDAKGAAGLDSVTQLTFTFDVVTNTNLVVDFDAIVDQLVEISGEAASPAFAQTFTTTNFTLLNNDTGDFVKWNPTGGGCNDSSSHADLNTLTCVSTVSGADLNRTFSVATVPNSSATNTNLGGPVGSDQFTGIFNVALGGNFTLTLSTTTRVSLARTPIPEPASLLLLGSGLMGLGFARRRKAAA